MAQPCDGDPQEPGMRAGEEREVKVSGKPRHTREEVLVNVHQGCCWKDEECDQTEVKV